jgi:hypothetical protein
VPVVGNKPELNLSSVVYATDFSLCSQNAGLYAAQLAQYFSAKLLVAHAFTLSQPAMEVEIDHTLISQHRKELQFLLSEMGIEMRTSGAFPLILDAECPVLTITG